MWTTIGFVAVAVFLYFRERFSIESISVGIIVALLIFFHFFKPSGATGLDSASLLSGFAAPALVAIMALLVVGQGLYHTGALEEPILYINAQLDKRPRRILFMVFLIAFGTSMFMNNTPVVVMFIPILTAMASRMGSNASIYMMPLSFICILAGMTTLIGSSTNLLVNDIYIRTNGESLGFFSQIGPGLVLAAVGAFYIVLFSPRLLPRRQSLETEISEAGRQYIAQIRITEKHPLKGAKPKAGLYPRLKDVTVRMIQRGDHGFLPPFEETLQLGDILIVAATRKSLSGLLSSDQTYLEGMLNIAGFHDESKANTSTDTIVISEAVIAPGSRMIGRNIEQAGLRRQTGCLVLGIQRRTRMIRKRMLDIRLEAGDVLLLFGYDSDMQALRNDRDLLLLDWSKAEVPDIRKSMAARLIFLGTILTAATGVLPIEIAALAGAMSMIVAGCLNIRQAVRALDMRIFLLIGAAFSMGLALENTGGAAYLAHSTVEVFQPFGPQFLIAALFLMIALMTNLISNSATALLFSPIALSIAEQTGIDPVVLVLTVIFASNCSFATPIAYQTNLLVMGPGRYKFKDFTKFGVPLVLVIWIVYSLMLPFFFKL
ncbi:MAG: SLC13 family permease [Hyphomonadaceae bacterium]|nr:SLC13 family permease [Hyphomonadaceae bacterium]MBC6411722.1 SLC13 family permease [Hyphomonadaceae bacterium]